MAVTTNDAQAHDILDSLDATYNNGFLELRTGSRPAKNAAATGTLVANVPLPADWAAAAASRQKAANGLPWEDIAADAAGTVTWARLRNAGNTRWLDFDVSQTGGAGDIQVDNTVLAAGQDFKITAFTLNYP